MKHREDLERIAMDILQTSEIKPNCSNRDFMNALIIFQHCMADKMFDLQKMENINIEDSGNMAYKFGTELRKLIHTYTGLDTHQIENFL